MWRRSRHGQPVLEYVPEELSHARIEQRVLVWKMCIEGRAIERRTISNILNRDFVEAFLTHDAQKGIQDEFARPHYTRIDFLHFRQQICPRVA